MDSQTGDRISYNLSEDRNALPQSLLNTVCSKLYVELLKTTTPEQGQHGEEDIAEKKQAANHAVFKIIFADKWGNYEGMRLEVHVCLEYQSEEESIDGRQVIFQYGEFIASPSLSSNPSSNSLWTCSLPIHPCNVGDILKLLFHYDASEFQFVCIDNKYFGCRDWM
ncbi:hypothetical protein MANI_114246 [Metarhizium anisopliae]|nr:hypothetical protein MANI_114246 [Metarhizium anisopliae]